MTAITARAATALISADEFRRRTDVGRTLQRATATPAPGSVLIYRAVLRRADRGRAGRAALTSPPLPGFALPIDELLAG
jgi:hypothetical protein